DTQHDVEGSVLEFYRSLLAFRRQHSALAKGSIELLDASGDILAFTRTDGSQRLLCVFNMGDKAAEFTIPPGMVPHGVDCPGVTAAPIDGEIDLEPFGSYIGKLG